MYYILNETNQIIAADDNLLELCGLSHIDELSLQVALGNTKFDLSETNIIINTDTTRLKQILSNLIDNAIKFTQAGFVEMGYSMIENKGSKKIQFYIKDSGIGISLENRSLIFNRFRQIDESHTRLFGGTGIGLSISQNLAELLCGDLIVEYKKG